jgi:hypothetical protein
MGHASSGVLLLCLIPSSQAWRKQALDGLETETETGQGGVLHHLAKNHRADLVISVPYKLDQLEPAGPK